MLGQLPHQAQGIVGQGGVDRQDDVDQGPGSPAHLLPGPELGCLDGQPLAPGQDGVGHVAVRFEDVGGQPAGKEAQGLLGHFLELPGAHALAHPGHFLDERGVGLAVLQLSGIAPEEFAPDRFLGLEVIDRVIGQFIEQAIKNRLIGLEGDVARQLVEQAH